MYHTTHQPRHKPLQIQLEKTGEGGPPGQFTGPPDAALCCDLSGGHWSLAVTDRPAFHSTRSSTETELKSPPLADNRSYFCALRLVLSSSLSLFVSVIPQHTPWSFLLRRAAGMGLLVLIKFERKGVNPLASSRGFVLPSKSELTTPNFRYRSGKFWCCLIPRSSLLLTEGILSDSSLLAEVESELVLGPARGSQRARLRQWAESHRSDCASLPLVGRCVRVCGDSSQKPIGKL